MVPELPPKPNQTTDLPVNSEQIYGFLSNGSSRLGAGPIATTFGSTPVFGSVTPWWVPLHPVAQPADPFPEICPSGDCSSAIDRLYLFLDGEMTDERSSAVRRHLDACPPCFAAFGFEAQLRNVVQRSMQMPVPSSLADRIRLALNSDSPGTLRPSE